MTGEVTIPADLLVKAQAHYKSSLEHLDATHGMSFLGLVVGSIALVNDASPALKLVVVAALAPAIAALLWSSYRAKMPKRMAEIAFQGGTTPAEKHAERAIRRQVFRAAFVPRYAPMFFVSTLLYVMLIVLAFGQYVAAQ